MQGKVLSLLLLLSVVVSQDQSLDTVQLIRSKGYPVESHFVETDDSFVLTLHRIPHGVSKRKVGQVGPRVVLLQHGLLDTSATWVINSPDESLGFILADSGFDVWLLNSRGSKYGMGNYNWAPSDDQFWNWNWDQHASSDIPASVDYVRGITKANQVNFIGHSQGATAGIACFCTNSTIASRVKLNIAMAPVTYLRAQTSPLLSALAAIRADVILRLVGDRKFQPTPSILQQLLGSACATNPGICNNALGALFGTSTMLNSSRMNVYTSHWPDTTSVQNMIHWLRNTLSKEFQTYNGINYFPQYIGTPTQIYYGNRDFLADPTDIGSLATAIGGMLISSDVLDGYTHMDFTWSYNAASSVYPSVLQLLKKYNP